MSLRGPTHADIAYAIAKAIRSGIADFSIARLWADAMIEETPAAEPWMIDLSFCTADNALYFLASVPGVFDLRTANGLLLGMAYDAHGSEKMDAGRLLTIAWDIYIAEYRTDFYNWIFELDQIVDAYDSGLVTEIEYERATAVIMKSLEHYSCNLPHFLRGSDS